MYVLPGYSDFEGHHVTQGIGTSPATFILWNSGSNGFDITPSTQSDVGTYSVSLTLRDDGGA